MSTTVKNLSHLVSELKLSPVLVDIGCSGARHKIWDPIAPVSTFVGFDPDSREMNESTQWDYKSTIIIDRVICDDDSNEEVDFVFTSNPYCSSMLQPDLKALKNYIFYDYFVPDRKGKVPATSLNRVMNEIPLISFDWIKIDAQGMDLKIIKSLDEKYFSRVVAMDVEPGFISAYQGEDHFSDVHNYLLSKGFWLAELNLQKYPRITTGSARQINRLLGLPEEDGVESFLTPSPTAAEARYLRTIPVAKEYAEEQMLLLYVFSILCNQLGYAFDILVEYEKRYGQSKKYEYASGYLIHALKNKSRMPHWKHNLIKKIIAVFPSFKRFL